MEFTEARAIVKTLAQGIDPVTGEVFPENSPYNHPLIIRALFEIHDACLRDRRGARTQEERRQENVACGRPPNAGLRWSDDDRQRVASEFEAGTSIAELARSLERSEFAIQSELVRQGLLESTGEAPARHG